MEIYINTTCFHPFHPRWIGIISSKTTVFWGSRLVGFSSREYIEILLMIASISKQKRKPLKKLRNHQLLSLQRLPSFSGCFCFATASALWWTRILWSIPFQQLSRATIKKSCGYTEFGVSTEDVARSVVARPEVLLPLVAIFSEYITIYYPPQRRPNWARLRAGQGRTLTYTMWRVHCGRRRFFEHNPLNVVASINKVSSLQSTYCSWQQH